MTPAGPVVSVVPGSSVVSVLVVAVFEVAVPVGSGSEGSAVVGGAPELVGGSALVAL